MNFIKKFFALIFALSLTLVFSTTAFASETESTIPEYATQHTITIEVQPGETITDDGSGIAPCIWGQYPNYEMLPASVTYIPISIPDRYMAIEASALGADGNAVPGPFTVHLMLDDTTTPIAGINHTADGTIKKRDWIDCGPDNYVLRICNNTGSTLKVTITYYSWA